jgi:hypothetical protein
MHQTRSRVIYVILCVLVLYGLFLRLYNLGSQSLWIDEAYTINGAQSLSEHLIPTMPRGEVYINNIATVYVTSFMMKVFGFDAFSPWSVRLPSVLFGTAGILAIFLFARELFRRNSIALLSAAAFALSYWEIVWSRQVRGYAAAVFFILLAAMYGWKSLNSKRYGDVAAMGLFVAAATLFHPVGFSLAPVFISVICGVISYKKFGADAYAVCVRIASCWVVVAVTLTLFVRSDGVDRIAQLLASTDLVSLLGVVIGLCGGVCCTRYRREALYMGLLIIVPITTIILIVSRVYTRYAFSFTAIAAVCVPLGVIILSDKIKKPIVRYVSIAICCAVVSYGTLQISISNYYNLERDSITPDMADAFSYIKSHKKEGDILISKNPVFQKLYTGDKGLWLPVAVGYMNSKSKEYKNDYYTAAPRIPDVAALRETVDQNHGFIILDSVGNAAAGDWLSVFSAKNASVESIPFTGKERARDVWVYRF